VCPLRPVDSGRSGGEIPLSEIPPFNTPRKCVGSVFGNYSFALEFDQNFFANWVKMLWQMPKECTEFGVLFASGPTNFFANADYYRFDHWQFCQRFTLCHLQGDHLLAFFGPFVTTSRPLVNCWPNGQIATLSTTTK
jgi:hypothetical protein